MNNIQTKTQNVNDAILDVLGAEQRAADLKTGLVMSAEEYFGMHLPGSLPFEFRSSRSVLDEFNAEYVSIDSDKDSLLQLGRALALWDDAMYQYVGVIDPRKVDALQVKMPMVAHVILGKEGKVRGRILAVGFVGNRPMVRKVETNERTGKKYTSEHPITAKLFSLYRDNPEQPRFWTKYHLLTKMLTGGLVVIPCKAKDRKAATELVVDAFRRQKWDNLGGDYRQYPREDVE